LSTTALPLVCSAVISEEARLYLVLTILSSALQGFFNQLRRSLQKMALAGLSHAIHVRPARPARGFQPHVLPALSFQAVAFRGEQKALVKHCILTRASALISLTMSYFHTGIRTIIGAESFHCPVRDGKEWDQLAMVIRLNW
jgi:hypothetical protein